MENIQIDKIIKTENGRYYLKNVSYGTHVIAANSRKKMMYHKRHKVYVAISDGWAQYAYTIDPVLREKIKKLVFREITRSLKKINPLILHYVGGYEWEYKSRGNSTFYVSEGETEHEFIIEIDIRIEMQEYATIGN